MKLINCTSCHGVGNYTVAGGSLTGRSKGILCPRCQGSGTMPEVVSPEMAVFHVTQAKKYWDSEERLQSFHWFLGQQIFDIKQERFGTKRTEPYWVPTTPDRVIMGILYPEYLLETNVATLDNKFWKPANEDCLAVQKRIIEEFDIDLDRLRNIVEG